MSSLMVAEVQGQLVVDSRLIAEELGIAHRGLRQTIEKYLTELQGFGLLTFETEAVKTEGQRGTKYERYCFLNEDQATFLMTLSRNTPQVIACKQHLVQAFSKAKQVIREIIPAQSDRIRELELQNAALDKQIKLRELDNTMLLLHGKETVLTLRGMADQLVETEKPTIEVIDERYNVSFKGQTLKQIQEYLAKKHGIKFKSGADIKRFLEKKNAVDLVAQTPRSILTDYVPDENLETVYRLLVTNDVRQLLIGE